MKNAIRNTLVLATAIYSLTAGAVKHEITKMTDILATANVDNTLVIFDIDNTLAEASETIGSVQWQENEIKVAAAEGVPADKTLDRSVRRFSAVNYAGKLRLVEGVTFQVMNILQSRKGVHVMALTARPAELHTRTSYLLNRIGIDLSKAQPLPFAVSKYENEQIKYADGILAVGPTNDKGESLRWLMSQPGFAKYNSIVFVDDKLKYVDSVEKAFAGSEIPLNTYRYGAADARVASFDPGLAKVQTNYFLKYGKILPDAEAQRRIENGQD
jgi:Protein of unknown function (DUF2608)